MRDPLKEAIDYLEAAQERLRRDFALSTWQRYDFDQQTGTLELSSDGRVGVVADIQIVGSTSTSSGTWLWSWANPSILPSVKHCMEEVREYGRAHGLDRLVNPTWPGDESDGWEITAVAAYILGAAGAYRCPDARGALFMILKNVRRPI